jgi:hypothetical protein
MAGLAIAAEAGGLDFARDNRSKSFVASAKIQSSITPIAAKDANNRKPRAKPLAKS